MVRAAPMAWALIVGISMAATMRYGPYSIYYAGGRTRNVFMRPFLCAQACRRSKTATARATAARAPRARVHTQPTGVKVNSGCRPSSVIRGNELDCRARNRARGAHDSAAPTPPSRNLSFLVSPPSPTCLIPLFCRPFDFYGLHTSRRP